MQNSARSRENDAEDNREVTDHQDKLPKNRTERQTAREARGNPSEIQNPPIAEANEDIASQRASISRRRDALSSTATSAATTRQHSDGIRKHTATHNQEDVQQKTSAESKKDKQTVEEPRLSGRIENEQEEKLEQLQAQLKRMSMEQSRLHSQLYQAQQKEKNMVREFNTRLNRYQLENQELSEHLQAKREESKQLRISYASLQETLDEIQERAFRSMNKGGWTAPEDGKVRDNFLRLEEKIKKWAKTNAFQNVSGRNLDHLTVAQKQEVIESLSGYCVSGNWDQIIQMMAPAVAKKVPYLFAQAMLSKDIFGGIFENPFFTLDVLGEAKFPASSQLFGLYRAMLEIDETEAHTWRAQMLRILQTPNRVSKSDIAFGGRLEAGLSRMAEQRSDQFLSGSVKYLLSTSGGNDQSVKKALADIYTFAGQLSLSVWTQRSFLDCPKLQHNVCFVNGHELMSAHAIHRLDDEEDTRLDGHSIIAIIQPAVLAFGNDDAEHYEQHKVWAGAIVLVDEST
ncbi:hypothetical protein TMatcc_006902 [Talaromyces marneffei ATCC 18224]|uniref:uncharacterized protein n=1 Tax=Talaromyces marneffei TaxID=37727 RepID=UPI0012A8AE9D|nr:uncharacterized protein EYB26_003919 [Talaromyces marneffei]KAE8553648.1 hypothetical protein EYB25_005030 [Talaromyces marneffei]QGA16252.1 hypothetical protein EYB26_003919 [Talaromyces marneffei]